MLSGGDSTQRLNSGQMTGSLPSTATPVERDEGALLHPYGGLQMRSADKGVSSPPPRSREFDIRQRLTGISAMTCGEAALHRRTKLDAPPSHNAPKMAQVSRVAPIIDAPYHRVPQHHASRNSSRLG